MASVTLLTNEDWKGSLSIDGDQATLNALYDLMFLEQRLRRCALYQSVNLQQDRQHRTPLIG